MFEGAHPPWNQMPSVYICCPCPGGASWLVAWKHLLHEASCCHPPQTVSQLIAVTAEAFKNLEMYDSTSLITLLENVQQGSAPFWVQVSLARTTTIYPYPSPKVRLAHVKWLRSLRGDWKESSWEWLSSGRSTGTSLELSSVTYVLRSVFL